MICLVTLYASFLAVRLTVITFLAIGSEIERLITR